MARLRPSLGTTNWPSRRAWPLYSVLSLMVGCVLIAWTGPPLQTVGGAWVLLFLPGMGMVRLIGLRDPWVVVTLSLAVSLALDTVVGLGLLYAGLWSPALTLVIVASVVLVVTAVELTFLKAPRRHAHSARFLPTEVVLPVATRAATAARRMDTAGAGARPLPAHDLAGAGTVDPSRSGEAQLVYEAYEEARCLRRDAAAVLGPEFMAVSSRAQAASTIRGRRRYSEERQLDIYRAAEETLVSTLEELMADLARAHLASSGTPTRAAKAPGAVPDELEQSVATVKATTGHVARLRHRQERVVIACRVAEQALVEVVDELPLASSRSLIDERARNLPRLAVPAALDWLVAPSSGDEDGAPGDADVPVVARSR